MQFAVIGRPDNMSSVPPPQAMAIIKAGFEFLSAGHPKIKASYPFADMTDGVLIIEAESGDELNAVLGSLPFTAIATYEAHAIGTPQGMLQTIEKAQQMMAQRG